MGVFDSIGNWFRGAFGGETDEEKKRKQQQTQTPQIAQPKQPTLTLSSEPKQTATIDTPKTPTLQVQQPKLFQLDVSNKPQATPVVTAGVIKQPADATTTAELERLKNANLDSSRQREEQNASWWEKMFNRQAIDTRAEINARNKATQQYQDAHGWNNDPTVSEYNKGTTSISQSESQRLKDQQTAVNDTVKKVSSVPVLSDFVAMGSGGADLFYKYFGNEQQAKDAHNNWTRATLGMDDEEIAQLPQDQQDRLRQLQTALTVASPVLSGLDIYSLGQLGSAISVGTNSVKQAIINGGKQEALTAAKEALKTGAKTVGKNAIIGAVAAPVISAPIQNYVQTGNPIDFSKYDPNQIPEQAAQGALWSAMFPNGSKPKANNILSGIAKQTDPKLLASTLKVDAQTAARLAEETTTEGVKNALRELSVDPNFTISDDVSRILQDEGIIALKQDKNDKYAASYQDGTITARDQASLDANVYHEVGHSIWQNKLTPEEKALFTGNGAASQEARGRAGYTPDDVNSEDFSDYMNKALTGKFNEVPEQYRPVVAKYANIALDDPAYKQQMSEANLKTIINDTTEPSYRRKQANDELTRIAEQRAQLENNAQLMERQKAAEQFANDPANRPAYMHKQDIQQIIDTAQGNLDAYLRSHQNLTPEQIDNVVAATRDKAMKDIETLQKSRQDLINAVDNQDAIQAEAVQKPVEQVKPVEGTKLSPEQPASPEQAANNAYTNQATDTILNGNTPAFEEKGRLSLPQLFSPDRILRENVTRPIENKINQGIEALQTSKFAPARGVGRVFSGFSREAGLSPEVQTARMQLRGGVETGKLNREAVGNLGKGYDSESLTRVWSTLDPEFAARLGKEAPQLTPEESVLRDKLKNVIDNTTAENLRRGLITPEQAVNESYIKRSYTVYDGNPDASNFERGFRRELLNQYKGRKEVSDAMVEQAITDPTYLVAKKTAESQAMWAMQDYGNFLVKNGNVSDVPRPGFTQLPDTPVFGDARGKFIPRNLAEDFTGFQYNSATMNAINDVLTAYDRWGVRQAKKQLLTIFNPAVRLGNQVTNRGIFANLGGINPVQFNYVYAKVGKMMNENHQLYREAVAQGLTGVDITQADFYARRIAASAGNDMGLAKKALEYVQKSYSGADDKARITAYVIKREQGYSPEEAARQVQRSFQDYKSVGFFYDLAAKTPIIGNAFVRFAADSIRIAKNAAVDHPLRAIATIMAWQTFVNGMSSLSGESQEDKTARENRFGAPKLPFTNISLEVQTPWGAVNVARFMPWYQLNDINDGGISKFLPFQASPVTIDENGNAQLNAQAMNDPLLGQFVQLAMDKDFRGKSIQDPNNTGQYQLDPLSNEEKLKNVGRFLFANNAPLGRETDAIYSAATNQGDIYGKERTLPQAIARSLGLKIEQYGTTQVDKQQARDAYYADLNTIDNELKTMTPSEQETWKKLTGYYKLRDQVANTMEPGTTRDKKAAVYDFSEDKWKDYAANPRLYELMVQKKQQDNTRNGTPIQPEFDTRLSDSFRKQLVQNKMVAPGDDAELDQRMYASPEWDYYQNLKKQYKENAKKYYGEGDVTDELVKNPDADFPEKPDILKQYSAAYAAYANGQTTTKPAFTDQIKAAREAYDKATFAWTNDARAKRGLPAITWDVWNNPTYGFDTTPSGYGYGGSRGTNTLTKLTNFSNDVSGDVINKIAADNMPNLAPFFQRLQAGSGGGKTKPKLGASASGK